VEHKHSLSPNQNDTGKETEQTQKPPVQEFMPCACTFDSLRESLLERVSMSSLAYPQSPIPTGYEMGYDDEEDGGDPALESSWWMSPELRERLDLGWSSESNNDNNRKGEEVSNTAPAEPTVHGQTALPSPSSLFSGIHQLPLPIDKVLIYGSSLSGSTMETARKEGMAKLEHIFENRLLRINRVERRNRQEAQMKRRKKMRRDRLRKKIEEEAGYKRTVELMQDLAIEYNTNKPEAADGSSIDLQTLNIQHEQRNANKECETKQKEEEDEIY
jgi:hypothetical protein